MIQKELVAASTEPLILSLLSKGESYGYELIQKVKRLSEDKLDQWSGAGAPATLQSGPGFWSSSWAETFDGSPLYGSFGATVG